ncbi:hypothetical protein O3P69_002810 [Scylla paramamosain]|uniref:Uncharacterized protein n=1 Tax=Scylla paramamosain TaxID=85552 RepID=A0AAW0USS9_SCYPA
MNSNIQIPHYRHHHLHHPCGEVIDSSSGLMEVSLSSPWGVVTAGWLRQVLSCWGEHMRRTYDTQVQPGTRGQCGGLCHLPVSPACVTCLCHLPVSLAWVTCLGHLPVSLACVTCLCHLPGSPACVTCLCHLPGSPACVTCLCHLPVSLACVTCLGHLPVSLACVTCLCHLPVSPGQHRPVSIQQKWRGSVVKLQTGSRATRSACLGLPQGHVKAVSVTSVLEAGS